MTIPGPDVFADLSDVGLEELELSARNRAANLRKSVVRQLDMWIEELAVAAQARWMRDNRKDLVIRPTKDVTSNVESLLRRSPDGL